MSRIVSVMQPTYLPWSGYFNLIASVDVFAFLDDVQFEHQSWQTRNRVLLQGQEHLLVVPIQRVKLATPIKDIQTSPGHVRWRQKHWKVLEHAYAKASHGIDLLSVLRPHYESKCVVNLADFNIAVIGDLVRALKLPTKLIRTSTLGCTGNRSDRLISVCEKLRATDYLSPCGSADYLKEDGFSSRANAKLAFQTFEPSEYAQFRADHFVSHLSIVDVIANLGFADTRSYIKGEY